MKLSRSLTRCGVFWTYLFHTPCTMSCASNEPLLLGFDALDVAVDDFSGTRDLGAMARWIEGGRGRIVNAGCGGALELEARWRVAESVRDYVDVYLAGMRAERSCGDVGFSAAMIQ
jgi:hypothetical protein